jgi:hypothetical protein
VREQREAGRPLEVTCFFEGLPSSVLGRAVTDVSKDSATLDGYSSLGHDPAGTEGGWVFGLSVIY